MLGGRRCYRLRAVGHPFSLRRRDVYRRNGANSSFSFGNVATLPAALTPVDN